MRARRLQWQIFGALSFTGVVCVLIASALVVLLRDEEPSMPRVATDLGAFIVADMPERDPVAFERELRHRARRLHASISVWDARGKLAARAGRELPPPFRAGHRRRIFEPVGHTVFVPLDDGRTLGISFERAPPPWFAPHRFLFAVVLLVAILIVGSHWAARRITRRLEALERSVQRFGEGDLTARAAVRGHDEVARLAAAWNRSAGRIAGLVDEQRRMLQSASHELRSPLARLRMALELATEPEISQAVRERIRGDAERDVNELDALISDLLLAGRLADSELAKDFERVALDTIVKEEAARVHAEARVEPCSVAGNPRMLRSLARNLLENARRHGKDPVVVTLSSSTEGALLVVEDAGEGVAEADRERIFEPFYRPPGHRETRDGGVGLGLSLVKRIAEHHGGSVRYVPRKEIGSRFEVTLPAGRTARTTDNA